jgi:hypothetical protein
MGWWRAAGKVACCRDGVDEVEAQAEWASALPPMQERIWEDRRCGPAGAVSEALAGWDEGVRNCLLIRVASGPSSHSRTSATRCVNLNSILRISSEDGERSGKERIDPDFVSSGDAALPLPMLLSWRDSTEDSETQTKLILGGEGQPIRFSHPIY